MRITLWRDEQASFSAFNTVTLVDDNKMVHVDVS